MTTNNNMVRNLFIASIVLNTVAIILSFMAEENESSTAVEKIENKYYFVIPPDRCKDTTMTYNERMYYESISSPKY